MTVNPSLTVVNSITALGQSFYWCYIHFHTLPNMGIFCKATQRTFSLFLCCSFIKFPCRSAAQFDNSINFSFSAYPICSLLMQLLNNVCVRMIPSLLRIDSIISLSLSSPIQISQSKAHSWLSPVISRYLHVRWYLSSYRHLVLSLNANSNLEYIIII